MVLRSLEQKLESLLEGVFGRAFKANVQPVELARKLAKEMDEHRTISVSRVYVPNEYVLYLSTGDREQFSGYEASLLGELQEYLIEHARREGYALLTQPRVLMETDSDLQIGEFGIATRMAQPKGADLVPDAPEVEAGATMIYKPRTPELEPEGPAEPAPSPEQRNRPDKGKFLSLSPGSKHTARGQDFSCCLSPECPQKRTIAISWRCRKNWHPSLRDPVYTFFRMPSIKSFTWGRQRNCGTA